MSSNTAKKPAKHGLGKGLSALMSDSYSQTAIRAMDEKTTVIEKGEKAPKLLPLGRIRSGKYQPREYFNETTLSELANSIQRNGVLQPIIVRKVENEQYEIIAGERRWRAAKIAGLDEIPVVIRDVPNEHALELAIVENVQREDLHPLEEATGYQRLIDEFKYTQDNIATTVYKSRSHIANLLRLLTLPKEVQEMLSQEKISMGHARTLVGVGKATEIAEEIIRRGLNVRQTEKLISNSKNPNKPPRKPRATKAEMAAQAAAAATIASAPAQMVYQQSPQGGPKDQDVLALEETLSENLGLKVSINDRGQSGEIMIAYSTLEQLDDILRRLGGSI